MEFRFIFLRTNPMSASKFQNYRLEQFPVSSLLKCVKYPGWSLPTLLTSPKGPMEPHTAAGEHNLSQTPSDFSYLKSLRFVLKILRYQFKKKTFLTSPTGPIPPHQHKTQLSHFKYVNF